MNADADLDLITQAALAAGRLALDLRGRGLSIEYKAGDSPVTNADLAVDRLLKDTLRAARPGYGWLSEETADDPERLGKQRLFVVDPIDGTRAFLKDRPWWVVSVAVVDGARPVAGVIVAPQLDETYTARRGGGAWLNGAPIQASTVEQLEGSSMVIDPNLLAHPGWPTPWPAIRAQQRNATAYRMCLVASGAFDSTIAPVPKFDWDLAAADLIASEAGAFVGDHHGRAFAYNGPVPRQASLVCAGRGLAPLILERVRHIAGETPSPQAEA